MAALGTWAEADGWLDGRSGHLYKDGTRCWNGPARSTRVTLACGARSAITAVSEPEMCGYALHFETPFACAEADLEGVEASIRLLEPPASKDEL